MIEQPEVEFLGAHHYLVRARQGEEIVEIRVRATPAVIARLATVETDETRIIEATAAYLIARQRADDLPAELDLDDVAAAYDGFEDELRQRFADHSGVDHSVVDHSAIGPGVAGRIGTGRRD